MSNKEEKKPIQFLNRQGEIIEFNPFEREQSGHSVVYAKSGAGMSFITPESAQQDGMKVVTIGVGPSADWENISHDNGQDK